MSILNNNNELAPIGFYDSGVGGLTVLDKVRKILPTEDIVYFGDTLHMPYGEKTKEQLLEYSDKIFRFFESKNCKAVVMACNTTSSTIYEDVKDRYNFKLYPIVQSVSKILADLQISKLGVFATKATIESKAYEKNIARYNNQIQVFGQVCPKWVHIVEESLMNDIESKKVIKFDLDKMLLNSPEKIVLGCTHYPYLLNVLSEYVDKDLFIDPAGSFAEFIKKDLNLMGLLKYSKELGKEEFYVSSSPELFYKSAEMFYKLKELPKVIDL